MKKQTTANLTTVLSLLSEKGPLTVSNVVAETGITANQVNALEGIWSWDKSGATKALFVRKTTGGHTFLVITDEGKAFKAPEAGAKAVKPPAMTEEAARAALLEEITKATGVSETANA